MKTLYLDCFAGVSGDMFLGTLLDLGLDFQRLGEELQKLPIEGYKLQFQRVEKAGLQAASFKVYLTAPDGKAHLADAEFQEVDHAHHHDHSDHDHEHGQADSKTGPAHHHPDPNSRSLTEILELVDNSQLSEGVKKRVGLVFQRLGAAEARVHGKTLETIHFHEVGGTDAIVDIAGSVIGLDLLGVENLVISPLHLGSGFIRFSHGLFPVPAPATTAMVEGFPVYTTDIKGELVTPTGAALVTALASSFGALPAMTVEKVGYGAGSREREFPNVLRGYLGETSDSVPHFTTPNRDPYPAQHQAPAGPGGYHTSPALVLECNLDDMNPQLFEPLLTALLAAGALDVLMIPAQMKKNRPGTLLQVLANPNGLEYLLEIIFRNTTTLGVRTYPVSKHMLQRQTTQVDTIAGVVRVKTGWLGNECVNWMPEYEDVLSLAQTTGHPAKEIYQQALAAAQTQFSKIKGEPSG
ncbi:MAG TPA: nickel pincer cofactor biosynthesis protein LarC [Anaerolineales bacterium]|nr:nickel pincer cofactor biosynthesis protein LarC [Anaerolineales bacterium]